MGKNTKIICLCGSLRYKKEMGEAELNFVLSGCIVLTPCCMYVDAQRTDLYMEYKEHFDKMHKKKIDIADLIYVVNVDGYIGESTRSEIDYAIQKGKTITYLVPNSI